MKDEARIMERTKEHLLRHLEDLNDQIDQDGGRISDHMTLDGIKDCLKALHCLKELSSEQEHVAAVV